MVINEKFKSYLSAFILIIAPLCIYTLQHQYQILWSAGFYGWYGGFCGGSLWVINKFSNDFKTIKTKPTDKHWILLTSRAVMGAFSGATVAILFDNYFQTAPKQAAIGLIAGYAGVIIHLLANLLIRFFAGNEYKSTE